MRTKVEKVEEKKKQEEAFALWKKTGPKGEYYIGKDLHNTYLIGFVNTDKKNPNEPDIRVYEQTEKDSKEKKKEVCSLWVNVSKKHTKYLTGNTSEKEKIVAYFNDDEKDEKRPYIRAYFKDEEKSVA